MVTLTTLAVEADLQARSIDTTDGDLVDAMLDAASAAIRDAAGSVISNATSTFSVLASREQWLEVPVTPVVAVDEIKIDGTAVTDYKLLDGRLWRASGWLSSAAPSLVTVTVEHGLTNVPADIVDLCCSLAAAGIISATESGYDPKRGLASFGVDDYREGYMKGDDEVISPFDLPARTRSWLRQRFGGGTYVVGTY